MSDWTRTTRANPCPICSKNGWCAVSADGVTAKCMHVSDGAFKSAEDGSGLAHFHRLKDDPNWQDRPRPEHREKPEPREPDPAVVKLASFAESRISDEAREQLGAELGLSPASLTRMGVGWATAEQLTAADTKCSGRGCWTFPMRDAKGQTIGVRLRSTDGFKYAVNGSMQGIFIPRDLGSTAHHTLVITEGPTDCAALLDMGFDAVGRPSNTAGTSMIADLIRSRRAACQWREIVVLIDRDMTDDDPDGELVPRTLGEFFYHNKRQRFFDERLDTAFTRRVLDWMPEALTDPTRTAQRSTITGALTMLHAMYRPGCSLRVMCPPAGVKDARDWRRQGATEDDLLGELDGDKWPRLERSRFDGYRKRERGAA